PALRSPTAPTPTSTPGWRPTCSASAVVVARRPGDDCLLELGADQRPAVEAGRAVGPAPLPLLARHRPLVRLAVGEPVLGVTVEGAPLTGRQLRVVVEGTGPVALDVADHPRR